MAPKKRCLVSLLVVAALLTVAGCSGSEGGGPSSPVEPPPPPPPAVDAVAITSVNPTSGTLTVNSRIRMTAQGSAAVNETEVRCSAWNGNQIMGGGNGRVLSAGPWSLECVAFCDLVGQLTEVRTQLRRDGKVVLEDRRPVSITVVPLP